MTAVLSTHCRECGKDLTDPLSRRYGIGPDCRAAMTAGQLADAIRRNQPGYIPRDEPPSPQALANNARALAQADVATCKPHGGVLGQCAQCRRDNDPAHAADRIIALIQAQREAARDAAYEAWQAAHQPQPDQLTIGVAS